MKRVLFSSILFVCGYLQAQTELVFVFFKDKPNKAAFYANPLSELTQKSLDRRTNLGIALNDQDAPLEASYVQNVKDLGFTVSDQSKWLNGVAVNATPAQKTLLAAQPYVQTVESFVKNISGGKGTAKNKFEEFNRENAGKTEFNYGSGGAQIDQINLRTLHQQGFTGEGVTIAVLDTGFPTVNTGSGYARLRDLGKIKGGYNFISKNTDLYNTTFNNHGSYCLGVIGGYINGEYVGSAPDADFYLYVTESGPLEIPEEELYWIQAAEEADRQGVDIISASLGYGDFFDDSRYNYSYEDMTGTRSFVARGAQIASEKGIIVMSAAGNEGADVWHYIITPADNVKVFSVGAVNSYGESSYFSSYGPNYLGAIKPDASARGSSTAMVYNNSATNGSGTSFSTPLSAGGVASLLQALPKTLNRDEVKNLLRQNASLYPDYTGQMGYGILNFGNSYAQYLATQQTQTKNIFEVYPNPSHGQFTVESKENANMKVLDMNGRVIHSSTLSKGKNDISLKVPAGIYLLTSEGQSGKNSKKITIQ